MSGEVTGQGVHTDGTERAMLVCIDRENVSGAENCLFEDLKGEKAVLNETILEEGDALMFRDNDIYHYVSDVKPVDKTKDMVRTMLIAHYPANYLLYGADNPNNHLTAAKATHQLRFEANEKLETSRVAAAA